MTQKPFWLKTRLRIGKNFGYIKDIIKVNNLHTVCESALCPNRSECWERRTATFMILGDVCTRSCGFCAVETGRPADYDPNEPERIASAVEKLGLRYAVITSVTRDELPDGGASIWARTVTEIREKNPLCKIEVLIPDFKGAKTALETIFEAKPDVIAHNLETVPRLYREVRPQAHYRRSLFVLEEAKKKGFVTKTGIMVGLGEAKEEILDVMNDSARAGVDIFTIGQYLQPTKMHLPVVRFVEPEEFEELKRIGLSIGLRYVESAPLVRSSYNAGRQLEEIIASPRKAL